MEIRRFALRLGLVLFASLHSFFPVSEARAQSPAPPPAGEMGTITGIVTDASNGDTIIDAGVEVVGGRKKVRTGVDGDFTLKLPPGTYELRVFAPLYDGARLRNVVVEANKTVQANAKLKPQGEAAVQTVEVVAKASKAAEATQLLKRKASAVVSETVAAQAIEKSADSDAAEIVQRVPAVTVKDDKYIYVRGLGERYSSALLDGSRLPSTDPNKRVVPLDLFPSPFIESLSIAQGYTPGLPGDFSGGLVDIRLKEFPETLTYSIGLSTGVNTNATFQGTNTYQGSDLDWLGFGEDYRSSPNGWPDKATINNTSQRDRPAQNRVYGASFRNAWNVSSTSAPPNMGVNFSIGNSFGPFGASLAATYGNEYKQRNGEINRVFGPENFTDPDTRPRQDLETDRSTFETRLGAILTAGYNISPDHKLSVRGLVNRNSTDEVSVKNGDEERSIQDIRPYALEYREEQLGYTQASGEHRWNDYALDWRSAYSITTQDIPDRRSYRYVRPRDSQGPFLLDPSGSSSPTRTYLMLDESMTDSAVDLTIPFKTALPFTEAWSGLPAKLKVGPAYTYRSRNVPYRRYLFDASQAGGTGSIDLTGAPESILQPENLGSVFALRDDTRIPDDSFHATQEIIALYGMLDLPIVPDKLRLVGGLRGEYSYITTQARTQSRLNDLDAIPGVNLIYSPRDDMNVRYGYSRTVIRPDFRELTSTEYIPEEGRLLVRGNQFLVSGQISSHDLRWEWFLSPREVVSLSLFYKDMQNPIEDAVTTLNDKAVAGFLNAPKGEVYGGEIEVRKNMGFLPALLPSGSSLVWMTPHLQRLTAQGNVSIVESQVTLDPILADGSTNIATNLKRNLQGQAPYTVNAGLDYEIEERGTARVLYSTAGRRIALAGYNGMPDIYEELRHQLDFVLTAKIQPFEVPLNAKLAVENILNHRFKRTQGDFVETRYQTGVKFLFGLSYSF